MKSFGKQVLLGLAASALSISAFAATEAADDSKAINLASNQAVEQQAAAQEQQGATEVADNSKEEKAEHKAHAKKVAKKSKHKRKAHHKVSKKQKEAAPAEGTTPAGTDKSSEATDQGKQS